MDTICKEVTTDLRRYGMNRNEMIVVFFCTSLCQVRAQGLDCPILFPTSDSMRISLGFSHYSILSRLGAGESALHRII